MNTTDELTLALFGPTVADQRANILSQFGADAPVATAGQVLKDLQTWFADLAASGYLLADTYQKLGVNIPCELRARHNRAVAQYMAAARKVFAQLGDKVTQNVYDRQGNVIKTVAPIPNTTQVPISPPTFTAAADCTAAQLSGASLGFVLTAGWVVAGVAFIIAAAVAVWIIKDPPQVPAPVASATKAYTDCMATRAGKYAGDVTATGAIHQQCREIIYGTKGAPAPWVEPPTKGAGFSMSTWILIGLGAITASAIIGVLAYRKYAPAIEAQREREQEAEREARKLEREAKRLRRSAKGKMPVSPPSRRYLTARADEGYAEDEGTEATFGGSRRGARAHFRGCVCI